MTVVVGTIVGPTSDFPNVGISFSYYFCTLRLVGLKPELFTVHLHLLTVTVTPLVWSSPVLFGNLPTFKETLGH